MTSKLEGVPWPEAQRLEISPNTTMSYAFWTDVEKARSRVQAIAKDALELVKKTEGIDWDVEGMRASELYGELYEKLELLSK